MIDAVLGQRRAPVAQGATPAASAAALQDFVFQTVLGTPVDHIACTLRCLLPQLSGLLLRALILRMHRRSLLPVARMHAVAQQQVFIRRCMAKKGYKG